MLKKTSVFFSDFILHAAKLIGRNIWIIVHAIVILSTRILPV